MHPRTAKNRSKRALKKRNQQLREKIAELHGEMLMLQTILGLGDQFAKKGNRLTVRIPIPRGWETVGPRMMVLSNREIAVSFERTEGGSV